MLSHVFNHFILPLCNFHKNPVMLAIVLQLLVCGLTLLYWHYDKIELSRCFTHKYAQKKLYTKVCFLPRQMFPQQEGNCVKGTCTCMKEPQLVLHILSHRENTCIWYLLLFLTSTTTRTVQIGFYNAPGNGPSYCNDEQAIPHNNLYSQIGK